MKVQHAPNVVFEVLDGKAVLVDGGGAELITLNRVGTLVWESLAEPADAASLTDELLDEFEGVSRAVLERDIHAFLEELRGLGLLVEAV